MYHVVVSGTQRLRVISCIETHSRSQQLYLDSTFVSVPADFGGLSVDAYVSGIIAGVLEGTGFSARVTAHSVALEEGEAAPPSSSSSSSSTNNSTNLPPRKEKTVFLVKFAPNVLSRDANMM